MMSGETTLSTTGKPISPAAASASARVLARAKRGTGMPYCAKSSMASYSRRLRCSSLALEIS